ncbi:MAG: hypothetical protein KKG04_10070, partial [Candidatus Thermoplasmatota archaeon]|nr:hypothetical protein [Candidatus Thermoplasmatota archaeon]
MKWFAVLGLILFLNMVIVPRMNADISGSFSDYNGLVPSYLDLEYNASSIPDLIKPEVEIVRIPVNISYHVEGLLGRLLSILCKWKVITIELTLENVPEWCFAAISPDIVYSYITIEPTMNHAYLTTSLSPRAPGFKPFNLTVRAHAAPFSGPFGFIELVNKAEDTITVTLTPGYYSNFQFDYIPFHEIPPLELTEVPMNVTSFANAEVFVQTKIIDPPENWSITIISDVFIEPWGSEQFLLSITPPDIHNEVEILTISFNITAWGHP